MISNDSFQFINVLNQMNIIASRFLTKSKFDEANNIVLETKKYFDSNKKKQDISVQLEALEIMVHNYGEFNFKIPPTTDFGKNVMEHLFYYIEERKKMNNQIVK